MNTAQFAAPAPHGFTRVAYTEWGKPSAKRTLICAHGLTRNSRDFDPLARALSDNFRVVCPDMPGRGSSERLGQAEDYQYPVYLQICSALLDHLRTPSVDWLGTSMGGLIGMMLAAQPDSPVRNLILNDVGALVPAPALSRISEYVANTGPFGGLAAVETRLRSVHAPFGPLTDEQWFHLAKHSHWRDKENRYWLAYDPAIAAPFCNSELTDIDLWPVWEQVRCPTLVIRGAESDVLPADIASKMADRANCDLVTIADAGHAPALMRADEIALVRQWLEGHE